MDGSGSGCLGRGGLARGIQDPILSGTSLIRPTSPHAVLFPVFHQGKSLGEGVSRSSPQTSHRTGSSVSRLLQSPICGPEGFRGLAPHHRPVYPEHIHRVTALPYGDSSVRPTLHSPRRLDDLIGSSGRLPSGSNPPGIASVSSLHHRRSPIPVQGTVLRANDCPSGLYKAHGSNIRHSPSLRYQDAQIPRRLVDSSRIQDHLYSSEGQAPASVRGAGTTSESQKVIISPISGHDLSRNADLISSVRCETNRDKGSESPQYNRGVSLVPEPPSSSLATSSGPPFVPYSSGEGWDAANAITPALSQVQVELSRRLPSHSLGSSVPGGSSMVVLGDSATGGSRSFPSSAGLEFLLGRFRRRLGCHNQGTSSVRSLDSKPKGTLHQPQRDDGSTEWPLAVQLAPQRQDDRPVLRQCHDSRLSQAIGRHEVSGPVPQSEGDPPVDRIYADHDPPSVHPGVSQHESGSSQSAQPGDRVGVDTTPGGGPGSSSPVAGDHRPVRDLADGKAPSVLCPSVGTQGSGGGCIPPTLGQPPGVCLPSHSHHKESSSQTESLSPLRSHPDRPLLASKGMVSRSSGTSIRHSNRTTQTLRSAATTAFPSVSRKSPNALSDCVATLKRFARQAGFSETVAGQLALCRRTSTRLNYQARWGKFRKWCRDFHHRSSEPTIPKIAEFLTFLFRTEKAAVSTIKGYRAMLSSVFKFCLPEISTSPILKDLVRSFEISAPRPVHRSPSWDLDKVLEYLSGPPFEPLADASIRNKIRKALFLLAMATAKRVGELQALSFSVSRRGDDLVLHYDPFFLAKTESVSNPLPRSVIVQSLADFVGDLPEWALCPVRAVRYLRRAARSVEFTPSRLFVSPSDPRRSMSKNAMSFFLRQLITESGAVSSSVPPRAHDIRGIATSLNYYSNLSLSAIKEAATWKSNRVFAMRYLKDMSATRSRLKDMGPLIAAGSAVHQH